MENASKVLMLGFYAIVFAMSLSIIIVLYKQVDELYKNVAEHVSVKSIIEEDLFG